MRILVIGASGYLGSKVAHEAKELGYEVRVLLRKEEQIERYNFSDFDCFIGEATKPETIKRVCNNINTVVSCLGITRQKDGLTYDQVDFAANNNILNEAEKSKVTKFIYVSVINGEKLTHTKLVGAKEKFVTALKHSNLQHQVIRPNGFFSDMEDFYNMARTGRVYLFGDVDKKINPISGYDLAKFIIKSIDSTEKDLPIGGPITYSFSELAKIAFKAIGKEIKLTILPDWMRKFTLWLLPKVTPLTVYGPAQFFLSSFDYSLEAPEFGKDSLEEHFKQIVHC